MRTIQAAANVRVSPIILWQAIINHEALPRHTPFLKEVKVLEGRPEGVGTIRQCTLRSGKTFTERITAWEEGRLYCYAPDTSQARFPFRWAEACWSVEAHGDGSRLTYRLQYVPKSLAADMVNYPLLKTYGVWQIKKMLRSYDAPPPA
jgi:ribosome-associated toxin RatA of RatAB toxin-antitoxin module